ncbi:MAG: beta-L-arabinofuranosidase domain-containing protein [Ignavibacteriaceae bacterium]
MNRIKNYFNKIFFVTIASLLISTKIIIAGTPDSLRAEIIQGINECANYSANILLDEKGKSRCDYNLIEGKWHPYEPAWHTGQIINALVEAYKITKNENYLNAAKRAGDWWCSLQIKNNPKLNGMVNAVHGDYVGDYIVFATVTDGTPGLFNLYRITGIKKYAEVPTEAGKWMLKNMFVPDSGVFYDAINAKTGEVMKNHSPFWPGKKNQTLYDVARPNNEGYLFKDMYEFTGNEKYKKIFIDLCESLVQKQGKEGLWMQFTPNNEKEGSFHPRFNLWYAESLLEGYDITKDKRYLNAALKTLKFFQKVQRPDGTIYYKNYLNGKFKDNSITGSAVAFAAMLWIRAVGYGVGDKFKPGIEKSFKWIMRNRFSVDNPDKNLAGAVIDTWSKVEHGKVILIQRDIGTSFGLRFLAAYYHYKFGGK